MNTKRFMVTFASIAALTCLAELRLLSAGAMTTPIAHNSAVGGEEDCNRTEQTQHDCEPLENSGVEDCHLKKYFTFETVGSNVRDHYLDGTTQNKCLQTGCQSVVQELGTSFCHQVVPDDGP